MKAVISNPVVILSDSSDTLVNYGVEGVKRVS
jgi:hypothetical protein